MPASTYNGPERRKLLRSTQLEARVEARLTEFETKFERKLGDNTLLTKIGNDKVDRLDEKVGDVETAVGVVKKKLDDHAKKSQPLIDGMEKMQTGIEIIGNVGDAAAWIGKKTLPLVALGILLKVWWSTGSPQEAWTAALKILSGVK